MKKIKTINKLLNSLTLSSSLLFIGFNNQYQNNQTVITEDNSNLLNNYVSSNAATVQMGDIWVTVDESDPTIITGYSSGTGELKILDYVTKIADSAFGGGGSPSDAINSVNFSNATNLKAIGVKAFYLISNLTHLDLSGAINLTTVGDSAFDCANKITEAILYLPSIESIGNKAFFDMYNSDTKKLPNVELTLGKNVNSIGTSAFKSSCFKNITLDSENQHFSFATNLGPDAQVIISGTDGTFKSSSDIAGSIVSGDLVIPSNLSIIDGYSFSSTDIRTLDLSQATSLTTIGDSAFTYCLNLTGNLIIPSSVTSIEKGAFYGTNITSIDLSQATNLTTIGESAFYNSTNLSGGLVIPSSVTMISSYCFNYSTVDNLYFLSQTPPELTSNNWRPTVTSKVYVPQGTKDTYLGKQNFGYDSSKVVEWSFDSSSTNINGNFDEISILNTDIGSSNTFSVSGCSPETLSEDTFIWSLVPTGETKSMPNGLSMSKGKINWKNVPEGTYTFKIQSSFDVWTKQSEQTVTINVKKAPVPPEPTPKKSKIPLILGLLIGIGIPVILAIAFIIWYATKKKKTTVKI